jgi:hypothetical protein
MWSSRFEYENHDEAKDDKQQQKDTFPSASVLLITMEPRLLLIDIQRAMSTCLLTSLRESALSQRLALVQQSAQYYIPRCPAECLDQ